MSSDKDKKTKKKPDWHLRMSVGDDLSLGGSAPPASQHYRQERISARRRMSVHEPEIPSLFATSTSIAASSAGSASRTADSSLEEQRQRMFVVDISQTRAQLLEQEDTDRNEQVTVEDTGPKLMALGSVESEGFYRHSVRGTYQIGNLLQELALLEGNSSDTPKRDILHLRQSSCGDTQRMLGGRYAVIEAERLRQNPVDRLLRMIRLYFWPALVRRIDAASIVEICTDPKDRFGDGKQRIYVPYDDPDALEYYRNLTHEKLAVEVVRLPPRPYTPDFLCSIARKPGLLTLAIERAPGVDGQLHSMRGVPFMVPGGRFNEMYGWDSYFIVLGLLSPAHHDTSASSSGSAAWMPQIELLYLARCMVKNAVYEIRHYGKILNANRTYYLTRTQPPFLTDMAIRVHSYLRKVTPEMLVGHEIALPLLTEQPEDFLRDATQAAILEYRQVWTSSPRLIESIGLSRYCDEGKGISLETEPSHFDAILAPYAAKLGLPISEYAKAYADGAVCEPSLDDYFRHDRAVRESGHDTSYRLDGRAASLATVDLNSLLYKYERDIAQCIDECFGGLLEMPDGSAEISASWTERARSRAARMNTLMWNEEAGTFFDYNFEISQQTGYDSVTAFWTLWAGICTAEQVDLLLNRTLPRFEAAGGLVSGTRASRGPTSLARPNRQWDYPLGWPPHQLLAWPAIHVHQPLVARRLAYRWLYMLTRAFVDYNGVVPEKFDVVHLRHRLDDLEYGNQGTAFQRVPTEGFGWMNASYLVGLEYLGQRERRALGALIPPEAVFPGSTALDDGA